MSFPLPPSARLGRLFAAVQEARLFADSKTFADATPRRADAAILADWRAALARCGLELVAERDITANVIEALHRDTPRRRAGGRRFAGRCDRPGRCT